MWKTDGAQVQRTGQVTKEKGKEINFKKQEIFKKQ